MQPIFRLIEDRRGRRVHHVVGHLDAAVGRQAVHEDRVRTGRPHQRRVHLKRLEDAGTGRGFLFLSHRCPHVGVHGVGAVDGFKILANTKEDGSGTDVAVKVHALAAQPDAVGDQIWLEVTAEEVRQACTDAGVVPAAVSANVEFATATDEGVVTYIRWGPRFAKDGLTADVVA